MRRGLFIEGCSSMHCILYKPQQWNLREGIIHRLLALFHEGHLTFGRFSGFYTAERWFLYKTDGLIYELVTGQFPKVVSS